MIVLQRWDGKPMHSYYFIQLFFMLIDTAVYNQSGMSVTVVIATSVSAFFVSSAIIFVIGFLCGLCFNRKAIQLKWQRSSLNKHPSSCE